MGLPWSRPKPELPIRYLSDLSPAHQLAILASSNIDPSCIFLNRQTKATYERLHTVSEKHTDRMTTLRVFNGFLFSSGSNLWSRCGIPEAEAHTLCLENPTRVRLPHVLAVWMGFNRVFVKTTRGLYAWGDDEYGQLGVGDADQDDTSEDDGDGAGGEDVGSNPMEHASEDPCFVFEEEVRNVAIGRRTSFFRTAMGWMAAGCNRHGELGLVTTMKQLGTPNLIPNSRLWPMQTGPDGLIPSDGATFVRVRYKLLAAGRNTNGDPTAFTHYPLPAPTQLPPSIKVIIGAAGGAIVAGISQILAVRAIYNGVTRDEVYETPGPVTDLAVDYEEGGEGHRVIYTVDGMIYDLDLSPGAGGTQADPERLYFPWPITRAAIGGGRLFIERHDGVWFANGNNADGRLGVGATNAHVNFLPPVTCSGVMCIESDGEGGTFFHTEDGVFACGNNERHALGIMDAEAGTAVIRPMLIKANPEVNPLPLETVRVSGGEV